MAALISIIIPVYNDKKGLEDTFSSLLELSYPKNNLEIIIVDNNSSDGTGKVAEEFSSKYPGLVKLLKETSVQSSYAARNRGISTAKGNLLLFLDADMRVDTDLLERLEYFFNRTGAVYVGFDIKVTSENKENIFSKYDRLTAFPVEDFIKHKNFSPTACLAVKKELFDKLGLFDEGLISSGDYEFGNRVYNSGCRLYFDPTITVYHPARDSFASLSKQYFRKGKGKSQLASSPTPLKDIPIGTKKKHSSISSVIRNFKARIKGWDALSLQEKVIFTFLWLSLGISEKMGYLSGKVSRKNNP